MGARLDLSVSHRVLETAAGTGVATRCMMSGLPEVYWLVTDISEGMLKIAEANAGGREKTDFQVMDACELTVENESFDALVSLFGYMFYLDQPAALKEAYRALKKGGKLHMAVWDELETSPFTAEVTEILSPVLGEQVPSFLVQAHHSHDKDKIKTQLALAGFRDIKIDTVAIEMEPVSPENLANAFAQGTPIAMELLKKDRQPNEVAVWLGDQLGQKFGPLIKGIKRQAIYIEAYK
nr:class I SAM-dependent methyltransferase [Endozoicomonas sp. OPT23]